MRAHRLLLPLIFLAGTQATLAQSNYNIRDLGTLGGDTSFAYRINDNGQIAGQADTATETHAFVYDAANGMIDLGTLGGNFSQANDVNGGFAVGRSLTAAGDTHAFVYDLAQAKMQDIHQSVDAQAQATSAIGINKNGLVVGSILKADGSTHAFVYDITSQTATDLHSVLALGGNNEIACDINSHGVITGVGETGTPGTTVAYQYNTTAKTLTTLANLGAFASSCAMNESGAAAGGSIDANGKLHAVSLTSTAATDLGNLGGSSANALGINVNGAVVGASETSNGNADAFLYNSSKMVDLNSVIPATAGWELAEADAINSTGEIVGYGLIAGQQHAFLLSPVPATPIVTLSSSTLTFTAQAVNTTSAAQTVTLTVSGASLGISSITITGTNAGDFKQTNNCGSSVAAGGNCSISITFTPTASGSRTASLSMADNASGSPQDVSLTGAGGLPDFSIGGTPASATVTAGSAATYTIALTPSNGFNQALTLSCSGLPNLSTCLFAPPSVTPNGSPATASMAISTTATTTAGLRQPAAPVFPKLPGLVLADIFALLLSVRRVRKRGLRLFSVLMFVRLAVGLQGCTGGGGGGGKNKTTTTPGTTPGTYTVTVTATTGGSSPVSHNTTVALVVQ